jgi:hypothetical protein
MAASQASLELRNNSDANYRAICQFIHNGMIAGGWTEEYSSGDLASATAPAQNTWGNTKIYRSPAETGLTRPYLKLRFGSNNNAAPAFALEHQIGWAISGSDIVLGANGEPAGIAVSSQTGTGAGSSTARTCTIAVNAGEMCLALGHAVSLAGNEFLAFSRTRDPDNAFAKTDKLIVQRQHAVTTSNTYTTRCIDTDLEYANDSSNSIGAVFVAPSGTSYGKPGLGWVHANARGRTTPLESFLGVLATAPVGAVGDTVPIEIYGVERTFIVGNVSASTFVGSFTVTNTYQALYLFD